MFSIWQQPTLRDRVVVGWDKHDRSNGGQSIALLIAAKIAVTIEFLMQLRKLELADPILAESN
jgi:hypothetical protein